MSGLTLSEIREGLAAQLRANLDRGVTVDPYSNVGVTGYPRITIDYSEGDFVDYWGTFGSAGLATVRFTLRIEPGDSNTRADVAKRLDDFLSVGTGNGSSVIDALMQSPSLGLTGCTSIIRQARVDPASVTAELDVEVTIKKVGANA